MNSEPAEPLAAGAADPSPCIDVDTIRSFMISYISAVLDIAVTPFPTADRFDSYGLDSVEAVIMAGAMEEEFGIQIDPMELFEHPSVDVFAEALAARTQA